MTEPRWYTFHVPRHIAGTVSTEIGRCLTTEAEIREAFRAVHIDGNTVLVLTRP
jgi:hypothetical protein